jgi:hypothetical protein
LLGFARYALLAGLLFLATSAASHFAPCNAWASGGTGWGRSLAAFLGRLLFGSFVHIIVSPGLLLRRIMKNTFGGILGAESVRAFCRHRSSFRAFKMGKWVQTQPPLTQRPGRTSGVPNMPRARQTPLLGGG